MNNSVDNTAGSGWPSVFILLPVLNEVENIGPLLDRIGRVLGGCSYTVGILDDGSTDGTVTCLLERIRQPGHHIHLMQRQKAWHGSQRGSALHNLLLWGLHHTDYEIFVEMDGDLSHRPEELLDGVGLVTSERCDIAVASKYVRGSAVINRPLGRRLVSRVCSAAVGALISRRLRDYSNGYRFYTRAAAQIVADHEIRYGSPIYLTEVMSLWLAKGLRIAEFPTTYVGRNEGLSKLRMTDLFKAGLAVFEIAARLHWTGFAARPANSSCVSAPNSSQQSTHVDIM